jgi:aspartyl-tRNA synthetase
LPAFPKNNTGRDVMIDSPSVISEEQLKELGIATLGGIKKM